jgi:hypothetical protein
VRRSNKEWEVTSPFNWKGKPSIFTQKGNKRQFDGVDLGIANAARDKLDAKSTVKRDVLKSGAELGKRNQRKENHGAS